VKGAVARILPTHEAVGIVGVTFDLQAIARGVREAVVTEAGDVWTGGAWVSGRRAAGLARPVSEVVVIR
jgi:hypothetical protein